MNEYAQYMIYLLHAPFKKAKKEFNDWKNLMVILGRHIAPVKEYIFLIREETAIETSQKSLDLLAKGMRMARYQNETDEQFRRRLLAKRKVSEMAGTKEGILYALKSLGYENAEVLPVPPTSLKRNQWDGKIRWNGRAKWMPSGKEEKRWAEFMVVLPTENPHSLNNFEILKSEVLKIKQASSLPVYTFKASENIEFETRTEVDLISVTVVSTNEIEVENEINSLSLQPETQMNEQMYFRGYVDNTFFWDGTSKFDGRRKWKSELEEMEM